MGRLIDTDRLKEGFREDVINTMGTIDDSTVQLLMIGIDECPTAYDVDKVWNEITDRAGKATTKGAYRTYWECAKIVKGAVKDDDYNCNSAHADIL